MSQGHKTVWQGCVNNRHLLAIPSAGRKKWNFGSWTLIGNVLIVASCMQVGDDGFNLSTTVASSLTLTGRYSGALSSSDSGRWSYLIGRELPHPTGSTDDGFEYRETGGRRPRTEKRREISFLVSTQLGNRQRPKTSDDKEIKPWSRCWLSQYPVHDDSSRHLKTS